MTKGWVAACAAAMACAAAAQTPGEIRALLERGDARAAYELARQAPQRLGEPEFDFAFGVAAVNAGKAAEGVLALERYLLLHPDHEGARVELARGYFVLGDDARAREEFELALRRNPPPGVARVIEEHLAALDERQSRRHPSLTAFVEAGLGYDSNPRAGVDNPNIVLPVLGEVTVPEGGVRAGDRTRQYGGGLRATLPISTRVAVFAAGQADLVRYRRQTDFDQSLYAGSVGLAGRWYENAWRAGASRGYQKLADRPYRHASGVFADWSRPLGGGDAISAGVQLGKLEYSGANAVRDSDFWLGVIGWRRAWAAPARPVLDLAINAGRESNLNDRRDLSRDLAGARMAFSVAPAARWSIAAALAYQHSRYREPDAILQTVRVDRYLSAELSLAWQVTRDLAVRAELTEAKNESNLALYEYSRRTHMLRGRYEFR